MPTSHRTPKAHRAPKKTRVRGRPPSIDTEALLAVAREVFLERGIRATTLEVARRAGISEGAVFHRFKTKEDLFRAAMHFDPADPARILTNTVGALQGLDIRDALTQLATTMLDLGRVALPLMMMAWSNPEAIQAAEFDKSRHAYQHMLKVFAGYFEAQMDAGNLRRTDAEIFTRVFIGAIHHYAMTRVFAQDACEYVLPEGMFVRGLVDLLLDGSLPAAEPQRPSRPRRFRLR